LRQVISAGNCRSRTADGDVDRLAASRNQNTAQRPTAQGLAQEFSAIGNSVHRIHAEEMTDSERTGTTLAGATEHALRGGGIGFAAAERTVVDGMRPHIIRCDEPASIERPGGS